MPDADDEGRSGELFDRGLEAREVLRTADLAREMDTPLGRTVADDLAIPVIDLYVHADATPTERFIAWTGRHL